MESEIEAARKVLAVAIAARQAAGDVYQDAEKAFKVAKDAERKAENSYNEALSRPLNKAIVESGGYVSRTLG